MNKCQQKADRECDSIVMVTFSTRAAVLVECKNLSHKTNLSMRLPSASTDEDKLRLILG